MRRSGRQGRGAIARRAVGALGLALLALGAPRCGEGPARGGGLLWEAAPGPDSVGVGDAFAIEVRGRWPEREGAFLAWAPPADSLLVAGRDSTELRAPEGWAARRYRLTAIAPRAGRLRLPPAALVAARGETLAVAETGWVRVESRWAEGEAPDLKPLAPLVSLRRFPWIAAAAAAALLLATGAAIVVLQRRRRRSAGEAPVVPPPPPAEEFEQAIAILTARGLLERGRMRAFVQELSWCLRRYLGRRWERPALEATRPEIVCWLPETRLCVPDQGRVAGWLEETDRIKFAGERPPMRRGEELLAAAREIVGRSEAIFAREEAERTAAAGGGEVPAAGRESSAERPPAIGRRGASGGGAEPGTGGGR
ncbi:MAG: hypothetical protein FJY75_01990 [Candidatus Eisenbacteria bacterium]|uniref:DUF4381 domain-containing protein n=1 Tax=Eiseniibacteriota bacterium TaxID=2212470 RepID=A0A937X9Z1_UNCEI|nr:hypothetical protein [Candidatus Eisenbacteria bacterium]